MDFLFISFPSSVRVAQTFPVVKQSEAIFSLSFRLQLELELGMEIKVRHESGMFLMSSNFRKKAGTLFHCIHGKTCDEKKLSDEIEDDLDYLSHNKQIQITARILLHY